jgi:hypothetical protein
MGSGMNLFFFESSFNLETDPSNIVVNNSDAVYFLSDAKKEKSLIGGALSPRQVEAGGSSLSANATAMYRDWSRRWDASFS